MIFYYYPYHSLATYSALLVLVWTSDKLRPGLPAQTLWKVRNYYGDIGLKAAFEGKPYYVEWFLRCVLDHCIMYLNLLTNLYHLTLWIALMALLLFLTPWAFFMYLFWLSYWLLLFICGFPYDLKSEFDAFVPARLLPKKGDYVDKVFKIELSLHKYGNVVFREQLRNLQTLKLLQLCLWVVVKLPYYRSFNAAVLLTQPLAQSEYLTYESVTIYLFDLIKSCLILIFIVYPPKTFRWALRLTACFPFYDRKNSRCSIEAEVYLFDKSMFRRLYTTTVLSSIKMSQHVGGTTRTSLTTTSDSWPISLGWVIVILLQCLVILNYLFRV